MTRYQVRLLDGRGRVERNRELHCRTDEEAVDLAAAIHHQEGLEVWRADRLVWHFDPPFQS